MTAKTYNQMKHIKYIFKEIGYSINGCLRRICGRLSEDGRICVILCMLLVLVAGNWYFSFYTIYNWGKEKGREEITMPELIDAPMKGFLLEADSINESILLEHGEGTTENG